MPTFDDAVTRPYRCSRRLRRWLAWYAFGFVGCALLSHMLGIAPWQFAPRASPPTPATNTTAAVTTAAAATAAAVDWPCAELEQQTLAERASADESHHLLSAVFRSWPCASLPRTTSSRNLDRFRRMLVCRAIGCDVSDFCHEHVEPLFPGGSGAEEILVDPPLVTEQGRTIADDKARMSALLAEAGLRTPRFVALRSAGDIDTTVEAAAELRWPLVVKPLRGRQGLGVTLNVTSAAELRALLRAADGGAIVEEQIPQPIAEYRVLVVGGKVADVVERRAAEVVGRGGRTIAQLVAAAAEARRGRLEALATIALDEAFLAARGLRPDDVPADGERVRVGKLNNLHRGGDVYQVPELHPSVSAMAARVAALFPPRQRILGIDFASDDIAARDAATDGWIIEVNANPGLTMHFTARGPACAFRADHAVLLEKLATAKRALFG